MTIKLLSPQFAKSKAVLEAGLNSAAIVYFEDPSIFQDSRGIFRDDAIGIGEEFAVVMGHPKRNRFAMVKRLANGSFKVK